MTTLPKGVTKVASTGNYRVRLKRGDRWFLGGYHIYLDDAVAALNKLESSLPAPVRRTPAHASWVEEQTRQRAAIPNADMTGIYPSGSGWTVKLTRDQVTYYLGHYPTLAEAILERDTKVSTLLDGSAGPGYKTVRRPRKTAVPDLCPAAL